MKKIPQSVDDTLLDYLDGLLSVADTENIERELQQNPLWLKRLEELKAVTSSLKETKIEQPSKNFTISVMSRLDQYPSQRGFSVRNGIFLLAGVLIAIGIASVLLSAGVFDNMTTPIDLNQLNQVDISKKYIKTPLPSFNFNGKLIVNIIIILNLGLAWLVLDRVILKPFFQRRIHAEH